MADEAQNDAQRQFVIHKIYTKDVSFETSNTPAIFTREWKPDVKLTVNSEARKVEGQDNIFEVVVSLTVTASEGESTIYLAEVHQAGIFQVAGFGEAEMGPMFGAYCPAQLYPYAREVVSHLIGNGGFPPMVLAPINFDTLYQQKLAQLQQQAAQAAEAPQGKVN